MASQSLIKITYTKSAIGYSQRQKDTVRSLGLRRIGDEAIHSDHPAIRGMIRRVDHLVSFEVLPEATVVAAGDGTETSS